MKRLWVCVFLAMAVFVSASGMFSSVISSYSPIASVSNVVSSCHSDFSSVVLPLSHVPNSLPMFHLAIWGVLNHFEIQNKMGMDLLESHFSSKTSDVYQESGGFLHEFDQRLPLYQFIFEWSAIPIPLLQRGYQSPFSPILDWVLHIVSSSRLAGWKESNLLYVSHQYSA